MQLEGSGSQIETQEYAVGLLHEQNDHQNWNLIGGRGGRQWMDTGFYSE